jgi:hypothetical protein
MRAVIKGSIDVLAGNIDDLDAEFSKVEDLYIWIEASIGLKDEEGDELFSFLVCTPGGLTKRLEEKQLPISGRFHIVVQRFHLRTITEFIQRICIEAEGDCWEEIAKQISRYGKSEFERAPTIFKT